MNMTLNQPLDNATLEGLVSPLTTTALPILYLLVFVVSVPCNLLSVILLGFYTKRKTSTVIFAINLSIADLLYSAFLPFQVSYHFSGNDWHFGPGLCGISTVAFYCNMQCSILLTCAIALERYFGVVHAVRSRHWHSPTKALLVCLLIWTLVLIVQTPMMCRDLTIHVDQLSITTCFDVIPRNLFGGRNLTYFYFAALLLLFYATPLAIFLWCYCAVSRGLRQSLEDAGDRLSRKHTLLMVRVAMLCFVMCYLPNVILQALHMVYRMRGKSLYTYYKFSLGINSLNCCFDPFVYYLASRDFRQTVWKVLRPSQCCATGETEEPYSSNQSERACMAHVMHHNSD
ncbi:P2Y purinoceptor 8-like [Denticeps clupeoides]|nr:P2Y purinoceptor 8-like [Denticeps clupeoides]